MPDPAPAFLFVRAVIALVQISQGIECDHARP